MIGLIWTAVRIGRGKMGLEGPPRTIALVGLSVLTILVVLFLAPVNQQNTGVNGWWFTGRHLGGRRGSAWSSCSA